MGALPALAIEDVVSDRTIDASTPADRYTVRAGATLTGNQANLVSVSANAGSGLVLDGGSVDSRSSTLSFGILGQSADISLNNVQVEGRQTGVQLTGNASNPAQASITGGRVAGQNFGLQMQAAYTVYVNGTTVEGRDRSALLAYGGQLTAVGATFIGHDSAVLAADSSNSGSGPSLAFYGSTLQSSNGAAIQIGMPGFATHADVLIADGSRLSGEGGRLVDVQAGSLANVAVLGSALEGNLLAGDNAELGVTLGQGASLTGDILAAASAKASLNMADGALFTGRLENVADVSLANGATWQLVEDTTQQNLTLNGGVVRLGDDSAYRTLTLGQLSGNGGRFDLRTNFATGETDFIDVTGSSSGNHVLNVASSGSDVGVERIHVVHTADGGADFTLNNGRVDLGAWSYQLLSENGNSDWYLDSSSQEVSPGAASALALFNSAPSVWYGEMTTLRSRMGEIRRDASQTGGWVRTYGNKFNLAGGGGIGYRQLQQGLSFGADAPVALGDGQWRLGVMGGYSQSSLDLQRGTSGEVKSFYIGAYGTWSDEASGYYIDAVVKANRFRNEAKVALSDDTRTEGDYNNLGLGTTLEFGRRLALSEGWFVEPYAQLAALTVQGRSFTLDNGLHADGDSARSLLGKAGATLGRRIELGEGRSVQPYVRAAYAHEFAKRNDVSINDNRFNNDLSGSRGELGAGLAVNLNERVQVHADFDYAKGERVEQPWGVNAGVRYLW
ncbi:autotransporter outer membrane beta-barrel domain-containing protein [Pseudomonas typographi]|uniref:autotransporter outer membrane beta-barrel domain-containing protein n=1 Tax=Pseudomonas typographi TaxID=2715964 RepID=UPI00168287E9|nr:autotransporter outer membrane beta-barrel domain-containing protein [Pseudomonas typographi]MBD1552260.1 autotransporter outer membrane beta-barrel domain-containing protein [Pseudomonas typographi]